MEKQIIGGRYLHAQNKKPKIVHKTYFDHLLQFLQNFKKIKCVTNTIHDYQHCYNYHNNLDRRRNPYNGQKFLYLPEQSCQCQSDNCSLCHSIFQKKYHPLLYKREECSNGNQCKLGFICTEIHPEEQAELEYSQFFRFDIRTFKSQPCHRKDHHEKITCLYYHNQQDRRRSPLFYSYSHLPCCKQSCFYEQCSNSHNKIQQLYHPSRYKSKFCQTYPNQIAKCKYRQFCSFAHHQTEITIQLIHLQNNDASFYINSYKTVWCPYTKHHEKSKCLYAHNFQDYRRKPQQYQYLPERCQFWNFKDEIKSIEQSGCRAGMECGKCHGWMQQRYHPQIFKKNNKRDDYKFDRKNDIVCKKFQSLNQGAAQKKGAVGNLVNQTYCEVIYALGAPFFKQEKQFSQSSRITKAKTLVESDNDSYNTGEIVQNVSNQKNNCEKKNLALTVYQGEHELWGTTFLPVQNSDHKEQSRSKSEGKSDEHEVNYSSSIKDILEESGILTKLHQRKIYQTKIKNLDNQSIDSFQFLSPQEKTLMIRKLKEYSLKRELHTIEYSKDLKCFFIREKYETILEKLRLKKVKQVKLLHLAPKQIKQFSFLSEEEKAVLPKLLKKYINHCEFTDINKEVSKIFDPEYSKKL